MILLIDNYDSFTYNLYQYLGELGEEITVIRNDKLTISDITELNPEAIIISPGPGRPENAGICVEVIQKMHQTFPMLGICLGHQAIGHAFGAVIERAANIMHGKTSTIEHSGEEIFEDLPKDIEVMRYHSLVINEKTMPNELIRVGAACDDHEIMAIKHRDYPVYGLQFHPESVGTVHGKRMFSNFLKVVRRETRNHEIIS